MVTPDRQHQGQGTRMDKRNLPTEEEVLRYARTCSNWGRWGADDQLGTLNLVTEDKRRQAAGLVEDGTSVSCSWTISKDLPGETMSHVLHYMTETGEAGPDAEESGDFMGMAYHGNSITHVDALCHIFTGGKMYNGFPANLVKSGTGAEAESIELLAQGVVSRGVLLDIPRLRGEPWLDGPEPVLPDDLEAAEKAQGVSVESGDILLIRTGHLARCYAGELTASHDPRPGPHASCIPWWRERDIAMLAGDQSNEVWPSGYEGIRSPNHSIAIPHLGLWLIDNANLEDLAVECGQRGRWEFMMVIAPLRFRNATGSPANPLAVF